MIMKKKKKGKVRWLAVLLAGCLLLSIVPVTAFASEDTDPVSYTHLELHLLMVDNHIPAGAKLY